MQSIVIKQMLGKQQSFINTTTTAPACTAITKYSGVECLKAKYRIKLEIAM